MIDSLTRPALIARTPRNLLIALGVATTVGVLVGRALENAPRVEHISVVAAPPQVTVQVPQAAAPTVEVNMPAPAVASAPPSKPLRTLTPHIYGECIGLPYEAEAPAECLWDSGFPAVSADARLVAVAETPEGGGGDILGLSIRFLDANTGKLVRAIKVLSPDEYVDADETNAAEVLRMRKRIATRVVTAQAALDDGGYRTMVELGSHEVSHYEPEDEPKVDTTVHDAIYAEISGWSARIIDPSTRRVLSQHTFATAASKADPDSECSGWNLGGMSMWWDPSTRVVLASQWYTMGGCMCGTAEQLHVARVPLAR